MSPAEFISSIAWPLTALIIALLFRKPLTEALASATGRLSAGPFSLEWKRQVEAVEAELGRPPSISRGEIGGAAGRLDEVAESSPSGAIVEAFGQIEATLRRLLEEQGSIAPERNWSVPLLTIRAHEQGLITQETVEAIEGLSVLRNLAAHGQAGDVSSQRAHEFVALAQGVLYAIAANAKSAERSQGHTPPEGT